MEQDRIDYGHVPMPEALLDGYAICYSLLVRGIVLVDHAGH